MDTIPPKKDHAEKIFSSTIVSLMALLGLSLIVLVLLLVLTGFSSLFSGNTPPEGVVTPISTSTQYDETILREPIIVEGEDLNILPPKKPGKPCIIGGCSGEICAEEERSTICLYRPEFACYKEAICERQQNGRCGWTETPKLRACMDTNRSGEGVNVPM